MNRNAKLCRPARPGVYDTSFRVGHVTETGGIAGSDADGTLYGGAARLFWPVPNADNSGYEFTAGNSENAWVYNWSPIPLDCGQPITAHRDSQRPEVWYARPRWMRQPGTPAVGELTAGVDSQLPMAIFTLAASQELPATLAWSTAAVLDVGGLAAVDPSDPTLVECQLSGSGFYFRLTLQANLATTAGETGVVAITNTWSTSTLSGRAFAVPGAANPAYDFDATLDHETLATLAGGGTFSVALSASGNTLPVSVTSARLTLQPMFE